ncbi:DUF453-domain-containing protein [Aspergillus brunneoviolaceus CBS 621.78]|uniref:DUF453-domain-containing protein n=1 Tax=Aspergillus brunneoviolaceus CBS 621.78 TaxID=1450534 RepID=A0ACD1GHV5_9EURO|nr:DUF453-domain-containing protein [Aspergillus brunneoviolaceus CBS 621.78]RAH48915.1 DUF453-domain-containing protein [Aspergillus brunneoviolaceus CBS 621.78]
MLPPTQRLAQEGAIPAVWMRSGTSKGLFLHREHLPADEAKWEPILLALMGSKGAHSGESAPQTDGLGGGTSTTSKVAIVGRASRPGVDLEYSFVQVDFKAGRVDRSGTCGNMMAGVGPFAWDQNLLAPSSGWSSSLSSVAVDKEDDKIDPMINIQVLDTNTGQVFRLTMPNPHYHHQHPNSPSISLSTWDAIKVTMVQPGGQITGALFPKKESSSSSSEERTTLLEIPCGWTGQLLRVRATLIDCGNPFVLVSAADMPAQYHQEQQDSLFSDAASLTVETLRRAGSLRLGLATSWDAAARQRTVPKIAVVAPATAASASVDATVTAYSLGDLHPTIQLTGAVALAAALSVPGTVLAADTTAKGGNGNRTSFYTSSTSRTWRIAHPRGTVKVETVSSRKADGSYCIESAAVMRTARKLFEGQAFYSLR